MPSGQGGNTGRKTGADLGPERNLLRSQRRSRGIDRLKAKDARGESKGNERANVTVGRTNTLILTGKDDLSDWDDEELRRGTRRDKNGNWMGRPPVIVPKVLHDELVRRTLSQASEMMREHLQDAVTELCAIATADSVEAKDRLRAISMIMERVMGKSPDKVEISGQSPWLIALQAGVVNINTEDNTVSKGSPLGSLDIVEVDEWEEDE